MGAVASYPIKYQFERRQNVNPASAKVSVCNHVNLAIAARLTVPTFQRSAEKNGAKGVVYVRLKPRTFGEVADHFLKVTKPIQWPIDEPDVE